MIKEMWGLGALTETSIIIGVGLGIPFKYNRITLEEFFGGSITLNKEWA